MTDRPTTAGTDPRAADSPEQPSAEDVAAYLRRHPDFLLHHQELLSALTPPDRSSGNGVVDLQRFMVEQQRHETARVQARLDELIEVSRHNLSTQSRVHAAALKLMSARSFEHLIDTITHELAPTIGAEAVTLCVEAGEDVAPRAIKAGVFVLRRGQIDEIVGESRDTALCSHLTDAPIEVFGPASGIIASSGMVRLTFGAPAPPGLLAIGSRDPEEFAPGQRTELLSFLARCVEHGVRLWLDLPAQPR